MDGYYIVSGERSGVDIVACVALLISIGTLVWTIWNEYSSVQRRRADEYWYRQVLGPNCIEPLVKLLNDHIDDLQRVDTEKLTIEESRNFEAKFCFRKEELIAKLWLSHLFSASYYQLASDELDGIEDGMAGKFGAWFYSAKADRQADMLSLREDAIRRVTHILANAADMRLRSFGGTSRWWRRIFMKTAAT